jgi:hypothetical protein
MGGNNPTGNAAPAPRSINTQPIRPRLRVVVDGLAAHEASTIDINGNKVERWHYFELSLPHIAEQHRRIFGKSRLR